MSQANIIFEEVISKSEQIDILYKLLNERQHYISKSENIKYEDHKKFVHNHPYRIWFLVKIDDDFTGSFYITNENTIGINISEKFLDKTLLRIIKFIKLNYKPLKAIPSIRNARFTINSSPKNKQLIKSLEALSLDILQITYYFPEEY